MDFMELAKARYSVRAFSDKPIEKEKLDKVLEAGNIAPTAKNYQPHRIYVIQSEEKLEMLSKLTRCVYGAKTVLLFTYNEEEDWKNPDQDEIHSGVEDASIVATHIMLQATELGLGTCWVNLFPNRKLEIAFDLPPEEKSVLLMPIGYPADGSEPSPRHDAAKPIDEIVKYI